MRLRFVVFALLALGACSDADGAGSSSAAIKVVADERGYTPSTITLKRGGPAVIEFTLTTNETCARDVVIPDLDIEKRLVLNVPVSIEIPVKEARTYGFECGMGMDKGTIVVE